MRPELEEIKLLEEFLLCQLPAEAEMDIEIRMLWNQEYRQQVAQQRLAYRALREAGRQQLRQELEFIHHQLFG